MPTNLEIYQLLKDEEAALKQFHADLQGYIACRPVSDTLADKLQSQCKVIMARLDKVRAMLNQFRVRYVIKPEYRFYIGEIDEERYGQLYFEKSSGTNDYYCTVKLNGRPLYTIQGHNPDHFKAVILEES